MAFSLSFSSSMVLITALPMAQDTGFPPKVLKYSMPVTKASATFLVVTTAAKGCPLPIGLPKVTISGITSCVSKAHQCVPTLPNPTCTSSAIHKPPAALIERYTDFKYPSGIIKLPPTPCKDSQIKPPICLPCSVSWLIVSLTDSA